ncbi:MAG: hypothetical protein ABSC23_03730 [Bryobacteraceae bacterium]|jgi:hypothetical protein
MDWNSLEATGNAAMIAAFGEPATFIPQDGSGGWLPAQSITGVPTLPANFGPDPAVMYLWVDSASISPTPRRGDQVTYNGTAYVVADLLAGSTGTGVTLKLRIT